MNVICSIERHAGEIMNLIPSERAGLIAQVAGLVNILKSWFIGLGLTVPPKAMAIH